MRFQMSLYSRGSPPRPVGDADALAAPAAVAAVCVDSGVSAAHPASSSGKSACRTCFLFLLRSMHVNGRKKRARGQPLTGERRLSAAKFILPSAQRGEHGGLRIQPAACVVFGRAPHPPPPPPP